MRLHRSWWLLVFPAVIPILLSGSPAVARRPAGGRASTASVVGRLYAETNAKANRIIVLDRHGNGTLTTEQTVSTHGAGATGRKECAQLSKCPFLDAQGQIALANDRHLLFAVNAGSSTVTSFRITAKGLKFADQKSSSGRFPTSLSTSGSLLYVANTGSLNVTGFRFSASGKLTPIPGSGQKLDPAAHPGDVTQIGFDHTGKLLAVSLVHASAVQTFVVSADGTLGSPQTFKPAVKLPFGFVFDPADRMVLTQIHDLAGPHGSVGVYALTGSSGAQLIDSKPTGGFGPCWIVLGSGGRFVYVVNTGSGDPTGATIAVYQLSSAGMLTRIQLTAPLNMPGGKREFERTNELVSSNGRYLYVLVHGKGSSNSRIDIYRVASGGTLTLSGVTATDLPPGISGLAGG